MRPFLALILAVGLLRPAPLKPRNPFRNRLRSEQLSRRGLDGLVGLPVRLLPAVRAWSTLRIIRPGEMVTMDYSPTA